MSVIGIVRLAPGQVGYFDDLTRIHLTIASPEKPVISGMNTTNLKRAVKSGRILLSSGSLDVAATKAPAQQEPVKEVKVEAQTQLPAETDEIKEESGTITIDTEVTLHKIQEEKEDETPVIEEPAVEETVVEETVVEETIVEEAVVTTEEAIVEEAEGTEEVKDEVVEESTEIEESTETVESEVKAAAKKGSTKKK